MSTPKSIALEKNIKKRGLHKGVMTSEGFRDRGTFNLTDEDYYKKFKHIDHISGGEYSKSKKKALKKMGHGNRKISPLSFYRDKKSGY